MKNKLKSKINLNRGIKHIEDLSIDKFIETVSHFNDYIITEKLDGYNLVFGFDTNGHLYTSRESKKGKRFYSCSDYPNIPEYVAFRAVHSVLEHIKKSLEELLKDGEAVECEILYGRQPNSIVYGKNYIIPLRVFPTEKNEIDNHHKIILLAKTLKRIIPSIKIQTQIIKTKNGTSLINSIEEQTWRFESIPKIKNDIFTNIDIQNDIVKLKTFLNSFALFLHSQKQYYSTNDVIAINLNKIPKCERDEMKMIRENLRALLKYMHILPIKEKILKEVISLIRPKLQTAKISKYENIGIEGVVLLDKKSGEQIKIVDKNTFTKINAFNYSIRNDIKRTIKGRPTFNNVSLKTHGIYNKIMFNIAKELKISEFEELMNIKKGIKKHQGSTLSQTLDNLSQLVKDASLNSLQESINKIISQGLVDLTENLNFFKRKWKTYQFILPSNNMLIYNKEIYNRTLLYFAQTISNLTFIQTELIKTNSYSELFLLIYSKQLKSLF